MYKNHLTFHYEKGSELEVTMERAISPDSLMAVKEDSYPLNKKNKNFYLPEVGIPRFKRKVFSDENGFKNTNQIDKANCIIFSEFSKFNKYNDSSYITYRMMRRFKTSDLIDYAIGLQGESYASEKTITKLRMLSKTNPYIYGSSHSGDQLQKIMWKIESVRIEYTMYPYYLSEALEQARLTNPELKFYNQRDVQAHLSNEGVIIELQKYKELCKLIDSEDSDNVSLAMEIMANSNFARSIIYIFMLLIKRGKILYNYGDTSHVNFQHMLHYFNYEDGQLSVDEIQPNIVENIFLTLKQHNQFTKHNAEQFLSFYNHNENWKMHTGVTTNNELRLSEDVELDDIDDEDEIILNDY